MSDTVHRVRSLLADWKAASSTDPANDPLVPCRPWSRPDYEARLSSLAGGPCRWPHLAALHGWERGDSSGLLQCRACGARRSSEAVDHDGLGQRHRQDCPWRDAACPPHFLEVDPADLSPQSLSARLAAAECITDGVPLSASFRETALSVISQAEEAEQKEGDAALLRQTLRKGLLEREKSGKTTRAAVAVAGWNTQKKGQQWTLLCKSCCRKFGSWNLEVMSDVGQREQADRICKEAVKKRMRAVSPKFVLESRRKRYCISDDQVEEQAIEQKKRLVELLDPADVFAPEKTTGRVERMEFISGESGMEVVGGNESDGQEEQILRLSAQESFEETRSALVATKSVPARRETTLLPIKTFDPVLQHRFFCPWRKQFTSLLRQQLEIREETSLLSPNQDVRDLVKSSLSSVRMLYFSSVASKDL